MLKVAAILLLLFTFNAFAQETFPAIPPSHPDHSYYQKAIDVDPAYVSDHLIEGWFPYDSGLVLRPVAGQTPVVGRIVTLLDGDEVNPRNLVLTVNGRLYYVRTGLNVVSERITLARRWKRDENGFFLLVRGQRVGGLPGESARVTITLRIADSRGRALPELEYVEDRLGR